MSRRSARNDRRGGSGSRADRNAATILSILSAQSLSAWFDPAWTPGITLQDDSGTTRITAMQSRPISGQSQYTISQGTLSFGPAVSTSPNGRRLALFAGTQYLSGAPTLATQFVGTAAYTGVCVGTKTSGGTTVTRWALDHSSLDNRVVHSRDSSGFDSYLRTAAGAATSNGPGSAVTLNTPTTITAVYSSTDYSSWINGVASLTASANTRAPASLDLVMYGSRMSGGAASSMWFGTLGGLAICSGVLSSTNRQALERAMGAYYGYPF